MMQVIKRNVAYIECNVIQAYNEAKTTGRLDEAPVRKPRCPGYITLHYFTLYVLYYIRFPGQLPPEKPRGASHQLESSDDDLLFKPKK